MSVSDVADLYAKAYTDEFAKRASRKYLAPFTLDMDSFLERQSGLLPDFVSRLTDEMRDFKLPSMEAIICGVDNRGGHIYHAHNGEITPQDVTGFCSIGLDIGTPIRSSWQRDIADLAR